eukprot:g7583.t1
MINFLQTTTVAATLDLEWTDGMNGLFEASEFIGAIATSAISGPTDCLASSASKVVRAVCKMLLNLFVPAFVMLLFAALWGLLTLRNGEDMSYFGKRTVLSIIAVTCISYLGLTKMAVRAFYCVDVYDSADPLENSRTSYLAVDTSIECYKNGHFGLIAIAAIVLGVVTVAFPLISPATFSRNKQKHMRKDSWVFETAGFFFRAFKRSCLFWESLVMVRKGFLSIIVVFSYPLGGVSQAVLAQLVLLTSLYVHVMIKPYRKEFKSLNKLESVSLLISCVTFTLGLFFGKNMSSESVRTFLSIVIIVANSSFLTFLCFVFCMSGISHMRVVLQYEDIPLPDQIPWWRVARIFIATRSYGFMKLSS